MPCASVTADAGSARPLPSAVRKWIVSPGIGCPCLDRSRTVIGRGSTAPERARCASPATMSNAPGTGTTRTGARPSTPSTSATSCVAPYARPTTVPAESTVATDVSSERQTAFPAGIVKWWASRASSGAARRSSSPSTSTLSRFTATLATRWRTVTCARATRSPTSAEMVAAPGCRATTRPPPIGCATNGSSLLQWMVAPTSAVPFPSETVAAKRSVSPSAVAVSAAGARATQRTPSEPTVSTSGAGAPMRPYERPNSKIVTIAVTAETTAAMTLTVRLTWRCRKNARIRESDCGEAGAVTRARRWNPVGDHGGARVCARGHNRARGSYCTRVHSAGTFGGSHPGCD